LAFCERLGTVADLELTLNCRTTIETLVAQGFKPTRTVVLAFGFDEEASGLQGAGALGAALRSTYGEDLPFAFIVDEGGKLYCIRLSDKNITPCRRIHRQIRFCVRLACRRREGLSGRTRRGDVPGRALVCSTASHDHRHTRRAAGQVRG
jgi:acetylornithine deacetylase/succinyl-diaminopimelate desuccinylase-like protein